MSSSASNPKKIGIIIGSTRAKRIGPQVAEFVKQTLDSSITAADSTILSLVDIATFNLPVFDEPILPAMVPSKGDFIHEHSKFWTVEIGKYDAYVIVTAEYNYGVPGGLKNAIDYLYSSWIGKPALIISYGVLGGNLASASLKQTLEGMHLRVMDTRPQLAFPGRDAENHNMSPALISAMGGVLDDTALSAWALQKGELVKGFGELKECLALAPASPRKA
ncbi:hypothetical protein V502_02276 [Pseudogymnoascus sp. VKM F-4520 (FW-2644)]|nr:hypothetical protein V502_02276 [Pseudogymnoascus sp. VKM F-4520 (FW-2644)]